jgi:hypothetical protein
MSYKFTWYDPRFTFVNESKNLPSITSVRKHQCNVSYN